MVLNLEDSEEYAHLLGKYELLHEIVRSPEEIMKMIDAVRLNDVKRVCSDLFKEEMLKVAVIGPFDDEKKFEGMMKM
jgi:predicted Zn-dependent peptidase